MISGGLEEETIGGRSERVRDARSSIDEDYRQTEIFQQKSATVWFFYVSAHAALQGGLVLWYPLAPERRND